MLIINADKVNGKNNLSKREKIRSEVLRESKKEVHLYHNNSNKAVILNQSKMNTENKVIELSADVKKAIKKMSHYSADEFIKDSLTYAAAIKDGRMLCIVKSVSKSGMSRILTFHSLEGIESKYYRSYRSFFEAMGYKENRSKEGFTVSGCGMDMIFHTNYNIMHDLRRMGIISKDEAETLCQKTPTNL